MNKNKLKALSVAARRKLYVHYVMLFNDFYKHHDLLQERTVFRHYQQIRVRFKRLRSVMTIEEIEKITFTAG